MNPPKKYAPPPPNPAVKIAAGVIGAIIAAGGFDYGLAKFHQHKQDEQVKTARQQFNVEQQRLASLQHELETLESKVADAQSAQTKLEDQQKELEATQKKLAALRTDWQSANSSMMSAVEAVRQACKTTPVSKVANAKGEAWTNVLVKSIQAGEVTIEHESGMKRLSINELPSELEDRLQTQWWPELKWPTAPPDHPSVTAAQRDFATPAKEVIPEKVVVDVEQDAASERTGYFEATMLGLRTEVSKLRIWMAEAQRQVETLKKQENVAGQRDAKTLSLERGMDAREAGKQLRAARAALEKQIAGARTRIIQLEGQMKKLTK